MLLAYHTSSACKVDGTDHNKLVRCMKGISALLYSIHSLIYLQFLFLWLVEIMIAHLFIGTYRASLWMVQAS